MKYLIIILFVFDILHLKGQIDIIDTTWVLNSGNIRLMVNKNNVFRVKINGTDSIKFQSVDEKKARFVDNNVVIFRNDSLILDSEKFELKYNDINQVEIKSSTGVLIFEKDGEIHEETTIPSSKLIKVNLFYDALHIKENLHIPEEVEKIFSKYEITDLNSFFINLGIRSAGGEMATSGIKLPSSIIGLDVTTLADGLAKFLVSRVKKEMAIALFDDLSRRIRSDSTKDIQVLFKNTYGILDLLGDRIYDFHPYISSLRQNMEYDFQNMPESLQSLLEENQSHLYKLLNEQKNLLYLTGNTLDLAIQIKKNNHLGKTIAAQDFKRFSENADTTLIGSLQTLQEFSEALRDTFTSDTMPYWLDKSKINKLVNDTDLLICFMGLFSEVVKKKEIKIKANLSLYNFLNDSIGPGGVMRFKNFIKSLQNSISQIQQIHPKFRNASTEDDKKLQVVNYFDAAHGLIKTSEDLVNLFTKNVHDDLKTFYSTADNINGVIKYAVTKKYTLSAMHLAKIMEPFKVSDQSAFKTISFIIDKSLIIGQLAEAKTADEVKEVIESFAAPVGSWRDKRMAKFNLALDSYVGPGYIQSISKENSAIKDISNFSVSTPIGLSASFMLYKGKTPFTILTSLLDIGPITAKRFSDDTATIGKIYLKEILAPGIHGSISFNKKFPITFNVGYQQFPLLKKIGEVDLYHKSGISASINVNIPILTIKNDKINSTYLE